LPQKTINKAINDLRVCACFTAVR